MPFRVTSPAFADGASIPARHTCDGENLSPQLTWTDPPAGVQSFVVIVDDPDAPGGVFTHWVLYDVAGSERSLGEARAGATPGRQGKNGFGKRGYGGPCPPRGHGAHRYFFKLHALDVKSLQLPDGASRADVERASDGHVLGVAELVGRYERK